MYIFNKIVDTQEECLPAVKDAVSMVYMIGILIWVTVILAISLYERSFIHTMVGLLVFIQLFLMYYNPCYGTDEEELRSNSIIIGVVILVTSLLAYVFKSKKKQELLSVLMFGSILIILISISDFYFGHEWMSLTRHFRTMLHIIAVGLVMLALTVHIQNHMNEISSKH